MSSAQKRGVNQLTLLLGDRSLTSLDDLLPDLEWRLLETVCYESGRKVDDLSPPDLKRAIPQWGDKRLVDLVGRLYTKKGIALRNVVDYIIEHLTESNFRVPSLNRYRILKAQMEECKTAEKVDLNPILPEIKRELYKLMCIAADTLPMNVEVKTFSVPIPKLGKSLSDLGLLKWYAKKNGYSRTEEAVEGIRMDPELYIEDLREEVKGGVRLRKIQKYKELNWRKELVVSKKKRSKLKENAKKTEIYRKFENIPNFTWREVNNLVEALNRGNPSVKRQLLERYSRIVIETSLNSIGRGVDYTKLVKFGINVLDDIIDQYDFESGKNFPIFIHRKLPFLLKSVPYNAELAAKATVEKPRNKYEQVVLKFLYDFKDALRKYRLELESKLSGKGTLKYRPELVVTGEKKGKLESAAYENYMETSSGG